MTSIKLLYNHSAILFAINEINYRWDRIVADALRLEGTLVRWASNMLEYPCIFNNSTYDIDVRKEKLVLAVIFLGCVMMTLIIRCLILKGFDQTSIDKAINVMIFSAWSIYPDLCH